jgi:pimeloyl-ACP methyl ester carboxylesterase
VSRTGSQPFAPLTQPVSLNREFDEIPRTYVLCTADRIIPPGLQRRMIRDRELTDVVELDSGHHPQLSRIDELAHLLHQRAKSEVPA